MKPPKPKKPAPASHTPGPWRYEKGEHNDLDIFNVYGAGDALIAEVPDYDGGTTNEDDARLISSAPDLLAALKGIDYDMEIAKAVECDCEPCRLYETFRQTVKAAVLKAEGRE